MSTSTLRLRRQQGFTIVEIIVVLALLSILITLVFTTLYDLYQSNFTSLQMATQANNTRTALRSVESNITLATGYLGSVTPVTSPQGYNNDSTDWSFRGTSTTSRVLIAQVYATTAAPSDSSRALVYYNPGSCGNATNANIAKVTYIFFVKNQTLYRRAITPTNTCPPGPFQKSTCAAGQSGSVCQATDAVLLTNVTSFVPQYFSNTTDAAPVDVYGQSNDAVAAAQISSSKAITISIQTTQTINGMINTYQSSIRVNKFN